MGKKKTKKQSDWQMTRSERVWYYIGDTGRLFASTLVTSYMTIFLMFQGISLSAVAGAILLVKIIDSVDDVIFGFFVDRIKITEWKWARKLAGEGKYMPWYRLLFWTFPAADGF